MSQILFNYTWLYKEGAVRNDQKVRVTQIPKNFRNHNSNWLSFLYSCFQIGLPIRSFWDMLVELTVYCIPTMLIHVMTSNIWSQEEWILLFAYGTCMVAHCCIDFASMLERSHSYWFLPILAVYVLTVRLTSYSSTILCSITANFITLLRNRKRK